jgi:capsular polysaccharide export protein
MISARAANRRFLFLQGPPGPFFHQLAHELAQHGAGIYRIHLNGGDRYDWPKGGVAYRGTRAHWPAYFDRFVARNAVTDLVLFGDCRPMHEAAVRLAKLRRINVYVFEEGYIRPDWMTLERDGVNGYSTFQRDPRSILAAAQLLPPVPKLPAITAQFKRRARDSYWHYHHVVVGRIAFPFYRSHRQGNLMLQGIGWALRFLRGPRRARQAAETLAEIADRKYFLFPLQLSGDYQIRAHSPFGSMVHAAEYVLESFAQHAPADALLLVKEHPLDCGYLNWRRFLARRARAFGVADRVMHVDGGDLQSLCENATGMVCVNSTSGTLGLQVGVPVIVLGDAVYDVPGITHQGELDAFWMAPQKPDRLLHDAFKRVLHAKCLVRGGLASESAIRILVGNSVDRMLRDKPQRSGVKAPERAQNLPDIRAVAAS